MHLIDASDLHLADQEQSEYPCPNQTSADLSLEI